MKTLKHLSPAIGLVVLVGNVHIDVAIDIRFMLSVSVIPEPGTDIFVTTQQNYRVVYTIKSSKITHGATYAIHLGKTAGYKYQGILAKELEPGCAGCG